MKNRKQDFSDNQLLWLIVRHFLEASHLRELCDAIVRRTSNEALSLEDLCEEYQVPESGVLGVWAIRMRPIAGYLNSYLGRLIQTIAWQGDDDAGLHGGDSSAPMEELRGIEQALHFSNADIRSFTIRDINFDGLPSALQAYATFMDQLADPTQTAVLVKHHSFIEDDTSPLNVLLVKHFGDLCLDADRHRDALMFYMSAQERLRSHRYPEWGALHSSLSVMINQSLAAAKKTVSGPEASMEIMNAIDDPGGTTTYLKVKNLSPDIMSVSSEINPLHFANDLRATTVFPPQFIEFRGSLHAFEAWRSKRFVDAHRWFWATLRRQIAFGSLSLSSATKAHYGFCLIEFLEEKIGTAFDADTFSLGVRLLIESEKYELIRKSKWNNDLVSVYVTENVIDLSLELVSSPEIQNRGRETLLAVLYEKWILALPSDRTDLAARIVDFLSLMVSRYNREFFEPKNVSGFALAAIKAVGTKRPEFIPLSAQSVATAVLTALHRRDSVELAEAISIADLFAQSFSDEQLVQIIKSILEITKVIQDTSSGGMIVRPALNFLASGYIGKKISIGTELKERIAVEITRLTSENESEYPYLMFLLGNMSPDVARKLPSDEKIQGVVHSLQNRAARINSSDALPAIQALVIAPQFSGKDGVRTAIQSLTALINTESERPGRVFMLGEAALPLMDLSNRRHEIVTTFKDDKVIFEAELKLLADAVCKVWNVAAEHPTVFSAFSIPPATVPNKTVVHNWAYASATFGNAFGFTEEIEVAMQAARHQETLRDKIDTGQAIRIVSDIKQHPIEHVYTAESASAFYVVLGARLLKAGELAGEERKDAIRKLLSNVIAFGPNGQDIAVLLSAREAEITLKREAIQVYREKLMRNTELRNSLVPVLSSIVDEVEAEE